MKTKKLIKPLSLILAICLLLSACGKSSGGNTYYNDFNNLNNSISGESDSTENNSDAVLHKTEVPEGYIGIYTVDDLINSGANENAKYILMNNLDLTSVEDWEGIVNLGIFDGNNYMISNLHSTHGGLFQKSKYVKDLFLKNCVIDVEWNRDGKAKYIGGLTDIGTRLFNCYVSGTVQLKLYDKCSVTKEHAVGGLMGYQENEADAIIESCKNLANVTGYTSEGGSSYIDLFVGGIVGFGNTVSVCENTGKINTVGGEGLCDMTWDKSAAGGIVGGVHMMKFSISKSQNSGDVLSDFSSGGILGYCCYDSSSMSGIDTCYNSGTVSASHTGREDGTNASGILGYISHYHELEKSNVTITNCYNVGICSGADFNGAIIGNRSNFDKTAICYCAYSAQENLNITGTKAMFSDNKAMTLEEMKELNNYPFNNKEAWKNGTGDYPYPVIK